MKEKIAIPYSIIFIIMVAFQIQAQEITPYPACNISDSLEFICIDSSSLWEIGKPNKTIFNSCYSGNNSIVTKLDGLYNKSDTSDFIITITSGDFYKLPDYLGVYRDPIIEFKHRFITDSEDDYGQLELSFDNGKSWDILHLLDIIIWDYGWSFHMYKNTNNYIYEDIPFSMNSGGWIHTKYQINIDDIIANRRLDPFDTLLIKFSFITDSIGEGNEGWQIDDLCIYFDNSSSIDAQNSITINIFPNPGKGLFILEVDYIEEALVSIYNMFGQKVYTTTLKNSKAEIDICNQASGVYFVRIEDGDKNLVRKLLKE